MSKKWMVLLRAELEFDVNNAQDHYWNNLPGDVYAAYVGDDQRLSGMTEDDLAFFVLLVIESEGGV